MKQLQVDEYVQFATARAGHLYRSACLLSGGDTHLAEDLVQDTLGRIYVHWSKVSAAENPAAYAQTVLVRSFLGHKRRRSSGERPAERIPEIVSSDDDPTMRVALLGALARLSAQDRAVLVLRYWEDHSAEETAAVLQTSAGVVRTRSSRALGRLRALLGGGLGDFVQS